MEVLIELDPRLRGGASRDSGAVDSDKMLGCDHGTELYKTFHQHLIDYQLTDKAIFCAVSGGVDSVCLLDVATQLKQAKVIANLTVVHIHHGLLPQADDWLQHVADLAKQYQHPFISKQVTVERCARDSLEAKARNARYDALAELLPDNGVLVMAQHQDDQAETFLLQAMRGAGAKGLAAMPVIRKFAKGLLLRPWLDQTQQTILHYAKQQQLSWVEDHSNLDQKMARNYLRHQVLPQLDHHRKNVANALTRSAKHCARVDQVITELAAPIAQATILSCAQLRAHSAVTAQAIFRCWCEYHGVELPSTLKLKQIVADFLSARSDKQPHCILGDMIIRRFNDHLWIDQQTVQTSDLEFSWDLNQPLALKRLSQQCEVLEGAGLDLAKCTLPLTVRFRRGGERIRLHGDNHTRSLKKIMQQNECAPWQRASIPLIYSGSHLVAIVGIGVASEYYTDNGVIFRLTYLAD